MTDAQGTDSFDITGTSVSGLQNFLRDVPDTSVRDALEQLRPCCTGLSAAALSDMLVANAWEVDQIEVPCLTHDQKIAIRIYTCEMPFPVYRWFNEPFYSKRRSPQLLLHHAAFAKILLRATTALMQQPEFLYDGPAYRGMKLSQNAELKRQFDTYRDSFVVGKLLTLSAFTSVSLLDSVAEEFSDHVMFTFIRVRGVIIRALSQVPREAEVLVPPPSVFRIRSVAKFHGSLTVTLECVDDNPLTYLSPDARECMLMSRAGPAQEEI